jgi:uncharacterized protein (TIGR02145 family)
MSVQITSSNFNGKSANVTLFSSTGNTIPYTNATTISLGVQTIPFTYSSATISNEYGIFSCNFTGESKTCIINQKTPPDGDGNTYNTIKIGNQIWMSENLKTTKFQDGTPLDNTGETTNAVWAAASVSGSSKYWALVNGTTANTQTYGLLYNQFAVTGSTTGATANVNLCPIGWHVPTSTEFTILTTSVGGSATQLKSTILGYNGTNLSGYNALLSGRKDTSGGVQLINSYGYFWSTTVSKAIFLLSSNGSTQSGDYESRVGFSVRCLKN